MTSSAAGGGFGRGYVNDDMIVYVYDYRKRATNDGGVAAASVGANGGLLNMTNERSGGRFQVSDRSIFFNV